MLVSGLGLTAAGGISGWGLRMDRVRVVAPSVLLPWRWARVCCRGTNIGFLCAPGPDGPGALGRRGCGDAMRSAFPISVGVLSPIDPAMDQPPGPTQDCSKWPTAGDPAIC